MMYMKKMNPFIRAVLIYIASTIVVSTLLVASNALSYVAKELD
jgi:hypothetical protein